MRIIATILLAAAWVLSSGVAIADEKPPMKVLVVTSRAKDHLKMIAAATPMLEKMAADNHFIVDITNDDTVINDANLANYQVFVQLQEAPFDMKPDEQAALQKFIESGHGWVGIHAAGLTGKQFLNPGMHYWQWFEDFLGGIIYSPHPAYQKGTLVIEDRDHPITRGLPEKMELSDEWYEFNESPRPRVHVLAKADESTYHQNKPMGDHPMIWVNEKYHRMVYIAIGHDPSVCVNADYQTLLRNAILWAGDQAPGPRFRVVAMAEAGGVHLPYVIAAKKWLNQLAAEDDFAIDYIENADKIDDAFLSHYQLFIQLNYPPYNWSPTAMAAFTKYIEEGKGGWIGFHHASLLGEFDGTQMWPWFHDFMGGIRWKDYIPKFSAATVYVEDQHHPIMQGVPASFFIKLEEWYTWDQSPRPNVHVIASVDESTYVPNSKIKMGDHPVIWSNDKMKARNVYIFMGHSPVLFESDAYKTIFRNAIFWAANQPIPPAAATQPTHGTQ